MTLAQSIARESRTGPHYAWLEEMAGRGIIMAITPAVLSHALVKIVSEEAGCPAAWSQHEGPLTSEELYKIRSRIEVLLRRLVTETTDHEISSAKVGR